jgi:hypothetical protein
METKVDKVTGQVREADAVPGQGSETPATIGIVVNSAGAATPADADLFPFSVSSVIKKITWTNLLAAIKSFFDSAYAIVIPAGAFISTTIAGATYSIVNDLPQFLFAAATDNSVVVRLRNDGSITTSKLKVKLGLKSTTNAASDNVCKFQISARIITPGATSSPAYGTPVIITQTLADATLSYLTDFSGDITASGTIGDVVVIEILIKRLAASDAADTLNQVVGMMDCKVNINLV